MNALAAAVILWTGAYARNGADGNPHNWTRQRRCDHTDYTPDCGICEGFGGIPYGDKPDEIYLTTCEPIATPDKVKDPIKPVWGTTFTATHYNEILIGPKTDPFCFNSFPSNTSAGPLCYRADSGRQTYDAITAKALRYDLNVKSSVGNITTEVLHQGEFMWIVNHLPWYAAGVHQCICTRIHEGGKAGPAMYPVTYNWTDQMFFIGREKIGIEYMEPGHKEILDHWAFGPHHVWSKPEDGEIRRMWQPFNGLQVFTNGTSNHTIDPALFQDIPPALCKKKGGAAIRIKCGDDGYPEQPNLANTNTLASADATTKFDRTRAVQPKPRAAYRGESFQQMSATLNKWLARDKTPTKACDDFTAADLQQLQALLYLVREQSLNDIYVEAKDNRQLRAPIEDLQADWERLNNEVKAHPTNADQLGTIQRDGHCHEAVMWYVHQLTEDMKRVLRETTDITIPLLGTQWHGETCVNQANADGTFTEVCRAYQEQVTCASCHSNLSPPPGHDFMRMRF